jgi:hypothetical protein
MSFGDIPAMLPASEIPMAWMLCAPGWRHLGRTNGSTCQTSEERGRAMNIVDCLGVSLNDLKIEGRGGWRIGFEPAPSVVLQAGCLRIDYPSNRIFNDDDKINLHQFMTSLISSRLSPLSMRCIDSLWHLALQRTLFDHLSSLARSR